MKNFFFSIVIPSYNSQNTIEACIKSCLKQSFHDFEIIIVDDCSSDLSSQVIEKIIDTHQQINIVYEKFRYNQGASAARNRGIELANGEYVALLDSDDYFHKDKLKIINTLLNENKNIDLLGHSYSLDEDVNLEDRSDYPKPTQIDCAKLVLKNFAVTPSIVFKKSIKTRFDESMRYTEDHDFFIRVCFAKYNIYHVDLPLVRLNRAALSKGGQSANNWKMRVGEIKMYSKLYKVNPIFITFIPFLIFFSLSKHFYRFIKQECSYATN
jgi:glycosyltransferase involved in cell wall biosynthesis